eukprot:2984544-Rhodomonas_salina.1
MQHVGQPSQQHHSSSGPASNQGDLRRGLLVVLLGRESDCAQQDRTRQLRLLFRGLWRLVCAFAWKETCVTSVFLRA